MTTPGFMLQVTRIPRGVINHGGTSLDAFKAKDTRFVADWLKSKGLHKLCSVFEGTQEPFVLSSACKSVVYKPCFYTQLLEAFDQLKWTYNGAFEQLFGLGRGEFEQKFSKNSHARGIARGGGDV